MAKSNHQVALTRNDQGQISIFFSASLVVMVSIIAFVINIGLFVKAKINLQNATDSAAFAGAAVQSRQLSKIAYLNWDMRNIYKEWMFKYYVVGNLNLEDVENPAGSGVMQFKLRKDVNVLETDPTKSTTADPFNVPAVCIHIAGSETNICKRYSIPGLPEFGSSNLPGAEEASRAFMDVLISTKVNDCIDRTRLNMSVANTWAYNVLANDMDASIAGHGPAILSDRQGAWPRAVELAMRIRNLEFAMNRPAEVSGVCASGSSELTNCSRSIADIEAEKQLGNERLVKAFYSGYRNLGNQEDVEMKNSFTLREIPPKKIFTENSADASNLLLPESSGASRNPREKQWVDLKLMMVNYAVFYAAMIPRADSKTSGACDISKVAIPVPGYPMGFYKNPDVLTYYAVKGQAEFQGMFNPFRDGLIKLEAYSAAKPFGGRIGPALFIQKKGTTNIITRQDAAKYRSVPYIGSYDFIGVTIRGVQHTANNFLPGIPLPTNSTLAPGPFWLSDPASTIGGKVTQSEAVQFGHPNLVYDYEVPFKTTGYTEDSLSLYKISSNNPDSEKPIGLFAKNQFRMFKGTNLSANVTPEVLDAEVARVRAATSYEAANYMIPTPADFNQNPNNDLDSFGFISGPKEELNNGYDRYSAQIYAPLFRENNEQVDILWGTSSQVVATILDFMKNQESGMDKYKKAMNRAAMSVYAQKDKVNEGATGSADGYIRAAAGVSDIDFASTDYGQNPGSCNSLAGQFLHFYNSGLDIGHVPSNPAGCPKALGTMIHEYFSQTSIDNFSASHYNFQFSWKRGTNIDTGKQFMSAYTPGPFTGVGANGLYTSPIDSQIHDNMRRNHYSAKFIPLNSLQSGVEAQWENPTFPIYSEGDISTSGNRNTETAQQEFVNILQAQEVDADLNSIKY